MIWAEAIRPACDSLTNSGPPASEKTTAALSNAARRKYVGLGIETRAPLCIRPKTGADARHDANADRAQLGDAAASYRSLQYIGLDLHQEVVSRGAAVCEQSFERRREISFHRAKDIRYL